MNRDYVSFEIASELKSIGYNKHCDDVYSEFDKTRVYDEQFIVEGEKIPAPLYQQVFTWFEENHSMFVERSIETSTNEILNIVYKIKSWKFPPVEVEFNDYDERFDKTKSELKCIEKLIEIVKNKQNA